MTASGLPGGPEPAAADDAQRLKEEIERTREQLGEAVEQLAAKADVKGQARTTVAELAGRVKSSMAGAREQAAARTAGVRGQLAGTLAAGRQEAGSAGQAGQGQLQRRVAAVGTRVRQATPEPARRAVARGTGAARRRPIPLAVVAALVLVVLLAIRQWSRR